MDWKGAGLTALAIAFTTSGAVAQTKYNWVGTHICVVEKTLGVKAFKQMEEKPIFNWVGFPKSFSIQVRVCPKKAKADDAWFAECWMAVDNDLTMLGLKFSPRSGRDNAYPWQGRYAVNDTFYDLAGSTFRTLENGGFMFAVSGAFAAADTSETTGEEAWFLASGTCSPA